jgi:hypothetical protein
VVNRKANPAAKEALTRTEIRTIHFMSWLVELLAIKGSPWTLRMPGATNQHCNYGPGPTRLLRRGFFLQSKE